MNVTHRHRISRTGSCCELSLRPPLAITCPGRLFIAPRAHHGDWQCSLLQLHVIIHLATLGKSQPCLALRTPTSDMGNSIRPSHDLWVMHLEKATGGPATHAVRVRSHSKNGGLVGWEGEAGRLAELRSQGGLSVGLEESMLSVSHWSFESKWPFSPHPFLRKPGFRNVSTINPFQ